jgi:hypothetical protein
MSGGQHRVDEVTRTGQVGWTRTRIGEWRRIARQRKQRHCADVKVCAKGIKKESTILDEADFVRDVEKSSSHHVSQNEIDGDKP